MEISEKLRIFGKNVYSNRIKTGMTTTEVSQITGIQENCLIEIEKGNVEDIPVHYVFWLANAFKIKPYELCEGI